MAAAIVCSIYRTGVRRRWKKANACLYILSYYIGEYVSFVRTFSTPQYFPHLWYVAQEVLAVLSLLGKRGLSLGRSIGGGKVDCVGQGKIDSASIGKQCHIG